MTEAPGPVPSGHTPWGEDLPARCRPPAGPLPASQAFRPGQISQAPFPWPADTHSIVLPVPKKHAALGCPGPLTGGWAPLFLDLHLLELGVPRGNSMLGGL